MPTNPATSVRGPTHVVRTGKTPVLQPTEVRLLLDTIDTSTLPGLRDRVGRSVVELGCARALMRGDRLGALERATIEQIRLCANLPTLPLN